MRLSQGKEVAGKGGFDYAYMRLQARQAGNIAGRCFKTVGMRPYLIISSVLFQQQERLIDCLFSWLKNEENATVDEIEIRPNDDIVYYFKGGIEIKDKHQFDVECTRIVDKVYSFRIL